MPHKYIKSALRPAEDWRGTEDHRLLHEQYDSLFRAIEAGGWANNSDGEVDAPTGYFAVVLIEHEECSEVWAAFGNEDFLTEGQLMWMWAGQLAGYYLVRINSDGIIKVIAYDDQDQCEDTFTELSEEFEEWALAQEGVEPE